MGVDAKARKEATREGRGSKRKDRWGDIKGGRAWVIPVLALRHPNCVRLTPQALKLLFDLGRQYSGMNNGYLCPAWKLMREVGWKSTETLFLATKELEHYGWIVKTRQGDRNKANLYALTWFRIDSMPDRDPLDYGPTFAPCNSWDQERPLFDRDTAVKKQTQAMAEVA